MGRCTVCEIEIEAEIEEIIRSAAVLAGIHATGRASRETLIKWAFYKR